MRYMCALMEQERAEGMMEGRILGKVEVILGCLSELGKVPDGLNRKLSEETDIVTLARWVRLAARAQSIAVFEKEM